MYFNNDIKINKFINRSDFNNYLNCMFRTDSSQMHMTEKRCACSAPSVYL